MRAEKQTFMWVSNCDFQKFYHSNISKNIRWWNIYQINWILRSMVTLLSTNLKLLIAVNAYPMLAENQYMSYIENQLANDGYQNCTLNDFYILQIFLLLDMLVDGQQ